jgi:CHAT domain-containing protein
MATLLQSDTNQRFLNQLGKVSVLPGTLAEVDNISALLSRRGVAHTKYLEVGATEEGIKSLRNPSILHIATHGYFLKDIPPSAEDEIQRVFGMRKQAIGNPLMRSGLLLAYCEPTIKNMDNGRDEDGMLTAQEVLLLRYDSTDLVVLSACETGLGEISNGEGVYGLQRSFMQAGARSLLMSLWTVSDEATQLLMQSFYEGMFERGLSKRTAFKEAQTKLRARFPEPYYWGAFVMIGE